MAAVQRNHRYEHVFFRTVDGRAGPGRGRRRLLAVSLSFVLLFLKRNAILWGMGLLLSLLVLDCTSTAPAVVWGPVWTYPGRVADLQWVA